MLETLQIRDFALIDRIEVEWTTGLNILTGETGAGKSIIIDALTAVLGGKAGASLIRNGADKAYIEGGFKASPQVSAWLKRNELDDGQSDGQLIVSREITKSGSRSRINGISVNQALVAEVAQMLLTVHAQHESRTLLSSQSQLEMLDSLGDQAHLKLLGKVRTLSMRQKDLASQLSEFEISEEERLRKLDFLGFQMKELEEAQLGDAGEDEELSNRHKILANAAKLFDSAGSSYKLLMDGADSGSDGAAAIIDLLQTVLAEVEKSARLDSALTETAELLKQSLATIEDAARELRRYSSNLDTDPESLFEVEARLAVLTAIKRKYGPNLSDAIDNHKKVAEELERLSNAQTAIDEIKTELDEVEKELSKAAPELSQRRQQLSSKLASDVMGELADLGMERCKFEIRFEVLAETGTSGCDRIDFLIAPNPGQPLMPLSKIASGGEMSRIMLAIKSIFASQDQVATVIFDEIDTGLSGKVLQSMRDKLARLARSHQILCITHQPIIAAVADNHLEVHKEQSADSTRVFAESLKADGRLRALAAMASGQENEEVALNFARSLIDQANQLRAI